MESNRCIIVLVIFFKRGPKSHNNILLTTKGRKRTMVQENITEVNRIMETLTMLKTEVQKSKSKAIKEIAKEARKLEVILEKEGRRYVEVNYPETDSGAIYDTKLNALFEAIGFLEERMLFPKEIVRNLDNAIMKLSVCATD